MAFTITDVLRYSVYDSNQFNIGQKSILETLANKVNKSSIFTLEDIGNIAHPDITDETYEFINEQLEVNNTITSTFIQTKTFNKYLALDNSRPNDIIVNVLIGLIDGLTYNQILLFANTKVEYIKLARLLITKYKDTLDEKELQKIIIFNKSHKDIINYIIRDSLCDTINIEQLKLLGTLNYNIETLSTYEQFKNLDINQYTLLKNGINNGEIVYLYDVILKKIDLLLKYFPSLNEFHNDFRWAEFRDKLLNETNYNYKFDSISTLIKFIPDRFIEDLQYCYKLMIIQKDSDAVMSENNFINNFIKYNTISKDLLDILRKIKEYNINTEYKEFANYCQNLILSKTTLDYLSFITPNKSINNTINKTKLLKCGFTEQDYNSLENDSEYVKITLYDTNCIKFYITNASEIKNFIDTYYKGQILYINTKFKSNYNKIKDIFNDKPKCLIRCLLLDTPINIINKKLVDDYSDDIIFDWLESYNYVGTTEHIDFLNFCLKTGYSIKNTKDLKELFENAYTTSSSKVEDYINNDEKVTKDVIINLCNDVKISKETVVRIVESNKISDTIDDEYDDEYDEYDDYDEYDEYSSNTKITPIYINDTILPKFNDTKEFKVIQKDDNLTYIDIVLDKPLTIHTIELQKEDEDKNEYKYKFNMEYHKMMLNYECNITFKSDVIDAINRSIRMIEPFKEFTPYVEALNSIADDIK